MRTIASGCHDGMRARGCVGGTGRVQTPRDRQWALARIALGKRRLELGSSPSIGLALNLATSRIIRNSPPSQSSSTWAVNEIGRSDSLFRLGEGLVALNDSVCEIIIQAACARSHPDILPNSVHVFVRCLEPQRSSLEETLGPDLTMPDRLPRHPTQRTCW